MFFKFEKLFVNHLEGFIFLSKEGGKLENFFKTLDQIFQPKNSKEFPTR